MVEETKQRTPRRPWLWVTWALVAVGAFLLTVEHRTHLLDYLLFLLLAACPLMHLFHGHGGHRDHKDERS